MVGEGVLLGGYFLFSMLYPLATLVFPGMPLRDVARAMINAVRFGAPKNVLEVPDMRELESKLVEFGFGVLLDEAQIFQRRKMAVHARLRLAEMTG